MLRSEPEPPEFYVRAVHAAGLGQGMSSQGSAISLYFPYNYL